MDSSSEEEELHPNDRAYGAHRGITFRLPVAESAQGQQTLIYRSSTASSQSVSMGAGWLDDDWYPSTGRDDQSQDSEDIPVDYQTEEIVYESVRTPSPLIQPVRSAHSHRATSQRGRIKASAPTKPTPVFQSIFTGRGRGYPSARRIGPNQSMRGIVGSPYNPSAHKRHKRSFYIA